MTLTQIKPLGLSKPVDLADNEQIRLGTGNDLHIYHDGTDSFIKNATGHLRIFGSGTTDKHIYLQPDNGANGIIVLNNAEVQLYYANSKKFETTSAGVHVLGTLEGDNFKVSNPGNNAVLIQNPANGIIGFGANNQSNQVVITTAGNLLIPNDSGKLSFGASEDLSIYHDGSQSYITNATSDLRIRSGYVKLQGANGENMLIGNQNTSVELYYDNVKKFETTSTGFDAYGGQFRFYGVEGGASQLLVYADEGDDNNDRWRLVAGGSNDFVLGNLSDGSWDTNIKAIGDGAVELYYDHSKKFETTSDGVTVTGKVEGMRGKFITDANYNSGEFFGSNQTGQSFGLLVDAGTNSSDYVAQFRTQANDPVMYMRGDQKIGIGTISPAVLLHIQDTAIPQGYGAQSSTLLGLENSGDTSLEIASGHNNTSSVFFGDTGASNKGQINYHNGTGGDAMSFNANGSERMRILSGGGLTFNGDTAAANALDDYEEGSWTATVLSGGSSITNDVHNNRYVKIGSMVFVTYEIYNLVNPNSDTFEIGGLPYTIANQREGTGSCMTHYVSYGTNRTTLSAYLYHNTTKFRFYGSGNATSWAAINGTQFTTSGDIIGSFAYQTV